MQGCSRRSACRWLLTGLSVVVGVMRLYNFTILPIPATDHICNYPIRPLILSTIVSRFGLTVRLGQLW